MFKKTGLSSLTTIALFTLSVPTAVGVATFLPLLQPELAAQTNSVSSDPRDVFLLPDTVAADTTLRIDGSPTMVVVNDTLKQQFESDYPGTTVQIAVNGTTSAIAALERGELDLVAVGRPLTQAERDRGLDQVTLRREKIAVIISPENPFDGNLTFTQFAQIFRGEITDWSEVGGEPGPITFVDRPEQSDTRLAFEPYNAFQSAPFVSGETTVRVESDETTDVIDQLGPNGISYALVSHVLDLDMVKIVPMHKTLPDNPAYPYSQPRAYAYMNPPSEAASAFLGYGLAEPGQSAVAIAQDTEAAAIASGLALASAVASTDAVGDVLSNNDLDSDVGQTDPDPSGAEDVIPDAEGTDDTSETPSAVTDTDVTDAESSGDTLSASPDGTDAVSSDTAPVDAIETAPDVGTADGTTSDDLGAGASPSSDGAGLPPWLWWLLPLGALALLLWWLLGRDKTEQVSAVDADVDAEIGATDDAVATSALIGTAALGREEDLADDAEDSESSALGTAVPDVDEPGATIGESTIANDMGNGSAIPAVGAVAAGTALVTGLSFLRSGRSSEAMAQLDDAIAQNSDDEVAWTLRGQALSETGQGDQAIASYDKALDINPDAAVALAGKGVMRTRMGQPQEAIALYDQALTAHERQPQPSSFDAAGLPLLGGTALTAAILAAKGKALALTGQSEPAISALNRASNLNPDDADVWTVKGDTLAVLGQMEAALASYDRAIERRAYSPAAYFGKGNVLSTLPTRSSDALSHYEWAATLTDTSADDETLLEDQPAVPSPSIEPSALTPLMVNGSSTAGVMGVGAAGAGVTGMAILHAKALAGQGRTLVAMGKKEQDRAAVQGAEIPEIYSSLTENNPDMVEQDPIVLGKAKLDQAIAINPYDPALYVERGMALASLGDEAEAIYNFAEAERLKPDDPIIALYKGHSLIALEQPSEALAAYDASLALEPHPNALLAKGTTLATLGHPEEAVVTFNEILDEDVASPQSILTHADALGLPLLATTALTAKALSGKGNALVSLGYTGAGLDCFQQAVETNPADADLWISQGNALLTAQQSHEAIASFDRALAIDPDSPEALVGKGNGLMLLGQSNEAQTYFDQASRLGSDLSDVVLPANRIEPDLSEDFEDSEASLALDGDGNIMEDRDNLEAVSTDGTPLSDLERALFSPESNTDAETVHRDGFFTAHSTQDSFVLDREEPSAEPSEPLSTDDEPGSGAFTTGLGLGAVGLAMTANQIPSTGVSDSSPSQENQSERSAMDSSSPQPVPLTSLPKIEKAAGPHFSVQDLADVDQGLADLPDGYGESRIVLLPRDPQWAYTYWDIPNDHKQELRQQGGTQLVLRLCDVTGVDLAEGNTHTMQQFDCDELARDWYLPIPVSDRDYIIEIGYVTPDERWLMLARSQPVRVPPVYPSDWIDEQFIAVNWEQTLVGQTQFTLVSPDEPKLGAAPTDATGLSLHQAQAMRQAGSLFGSMHQIPQQSLSSFVFPSGAALATFIPKEAKTPLEIGNFSGIGMSGIGFFSSMPPIRARKFWLIADAELIVYGATEPDATVTVAGQPIPLNPDGTFRFHMPFKDGQIDYPIVAIAADGEQTRSIHMTFNRDTPQENTNTEAEAVDEWF